MNTIIVSVCHFFHLLATVFWIGGIAMILLVILPGARNSLNAKNMGEVMKEVARRFTPLANASIVVLVITGLLIGHLDKGFFGFGTWETRWKAVLVLKHLVVAVMVAIHFYRGLVLQPRLARLSSHADTSVQVANLQKFSLGLVKTNFGFGIVVLWLSGILSSL
jgi:uncharacterized membrane protein